MGVVKRFNYPGELTIWLEENGIDTGVWGSGAHKTIANLWDEYAAGEVSFEANPPLRVVQVVQILIQHDGTMLLEKEQVLTNGMRRFRNQLPSEKIKGNETFMDAAFRCLSEELGLGRDRVDSVTVENESDEMIADSPSYPGLSTRYSIQTATARVSGLPAGDFWRDNQATAEGDPVSRHLWGWQTKR